MSLMAGFDFVAEISNEVILKQLKQNFEIGGVPVNPPFELNLPISSNGVSGNAHLIITDLQLDLNANDTITLTLLFNRSSAVVSTPLSLAVCSLDGNIVITAPLQLINIGGSNMQVSVNLGAASVVINWSQSSDQLITKDLSGKPITPAVFKTFATQALKNFVNSVAAPTIPLAFTVVPGTNGSLTPTLQFEKLEVHCISNANRNKQALGIFGILLVANHSNGNYKQKTSTAITEAHDGVCISIAPGAFHSLLFCPGIAKSLKTDTGLLPSTCGPSGGIDIQGVTVNSISDSFANGYIDINGSVYKSGTCFEANGTFHGTLTFSISNSQLVPHLNMDDPYVDVSIPWYCYLAPAVVLGPLGVVLAGIADEIADIVANSLASDAIKKGFGNGISSVNMSTLSNMRFTSNTITTEGIILQGISPIFISIGWIEGKLELSGSVITTMSQEISKGTFHSRVWCKDAKDYPYTESSQQQTGNYCLSGKMVNYPFTPVFTIDTGYQDATSIPLTGNSGIIELPNVNTHYNMPLATGGTALRQTVHITYSVSGTSVKLTNVPSEGNYSFRLNATAKDCHGNLIKDDTHQTLSTSIYVRFEGDHVVMSEYASDVSDCAHALQDTLKKLGYVLKQEQIPVWQEINYPAPENMLKYIRNLTAIGSPQMDQILFASKIAHGSSFYRAILSPAARQPSMLKPLSMKNLNELTNVISNLNLKQREN